MYYKSAMSKSITGALLDISPFTMQCNDLSQRIYDDSEISLTLAESRLAFKASSFFI